MNVEKLMTRDVITVTKETNARDIAGLLVQNGISSVPVVDGAKRPIGIVSLTDLMARNAHLKFPRYLQFLDSVIFLESPRRYEEEVRRALAITAADLMSTNVVTVRPDTDLSDAATIFFEKRITALPVVDQAGVLVGIISQFDLARLMASEAV